MQNDCGLTSGSVVAAGVVAAGSGLLVEDGESGVAGGEGVDDSSGRGDELMVVK